MFKLNYKYVKKREEDRREEDRKEIFEFSIKNILLITGGAESNGF